MEENGFVHVQFPGKKLQTLKKEDTLQYIAELIIEKCLL